MTVQPQFLRNRVTYEDGRKGKISATLEIKDAMTNKAADIAAQ